MAVLDEVWMRKRLVDARLGDCIAIVSLDSKVHRIRSSAALLTLELKVVIVQLASEGRDLAVSKVYLGKMVALRASRSRSSIMVPCSLNAIPWWLSLQLSMSVISHPVGRN